ncbi:MAG: hypothetical protein LIO56_06115 [Lachnospiraceae bacterium]|nr:hypothetical protein [Lachnospiraceae bacterium]
MSYKIEPGGLRLPRIDTEESYDALEHLTDDMKEYGKQNLSKVPPTEGWLMLGNNPDMQAFWQIMEREMTSLMEGDMQATPFGFMNLANKVIAHELKQEYMFGTEVACDTSAVPDHGLGYEGLIKSQMVDFPECDCWNDEERLCIYFVKACINFSMTDEIFQAAINSWGESMVVLRMSWIAYVWSMAMMQSAMHMRYDINKEIFPYGTWTPENVKMTLGNLDGSYLQVRELWNNMNTFISGEKEARAKDAAEKKAKREHQAK